MTNILAALITPETASAWTGLGTVLGIVAVAFMNAWNARTANKNAQKAQTDRTTAQVTSDQIHVLVNGNMGVQLRLNMVQARRIADLTHSPADVHLAEEAERLFLDHEAKQADANANPNK